MPIPILYYKNLMSIIFIPSELISLSVEFSSFALQIVVLHRAFLSARLKAHLGGEELQLECREAGEEERKA